MAYNFSTLEDKTKGIEEWLKGEFSSIRSGRATPRVLDGVTINSYGAKVSIGHTAGITIEDAKTLRVTPWDKSQIKEIEKALNEANLGLSIGVDDMGIRVSFPDLTSERREALVKLLKKKMEEAKISLRGVRDEVWNDIQAQEKKNEISEDERFRLKEEMEKRVQEGNATFLEMAEKKEKEIIS